MNLPRACCVVCMALALQGCATASYYWQAMRGHFDVMQRAQRIEQAITQPDTPPALRERLARVLVIRAFASQELALPDNGSYRSYAELGRPFALWNVFVAPEFSVEARQSCFLFAGCVTYRGFYSEEAARRYAAEAKAQGFDTFVGGVPAYSTLGYFDDPVLNTFIRASEPEVARLIFHELAHQVVYVKDDTVFNESFATAVEEEGLRRWLDREGNTAQREAWANFQLRRRDFIGLVARYRGRLAQFYAQPGSTQQKRAGKATLFAEMRRDYEAMKASWGGFAGYDRYFSQELNNALLAVTAAYTQWVPAFTAMIDRTRGDMNGFYREARELSKLARAERDAQLQALSGAPAVTSIDNTMTR
jgi:predicted aminopeptidase